MAGVRPRSRDTKQPVPNGLIHGWIGAVFTPNATIDGLRSVVHDYGRYEAIVLSRGYPEFCAVVGESGGEPSGGGLDVNHS